MEEIIERDENWVDVHDDELMVSLGIRYPKAKPRDPSVWNKTDEEKILLRKLRTKYDPVKGYNRKLSK